MTMALPEPGIAVDPDRVLHHLRQIHAQRLDAADYRNAQLTAACDDAQATIVELRVRAEALGNEVAGLRAQKTALEQQVKELTDLPKTAAAKAH